MAKCHWFHWICVVDICFMPFTVFSYYNVIVSWPPEKHCLVFPFLFTNLEWQEVVSLVSFVLQKLPQKNWRRFICLLKKSVELLSTLYLIGGFSSSKWIVGSSSLVWQNIWKKSADVKWLGYLQLFQENCPTILLKDKL